MPVSNAEKAETPRGRKLIEFFVYNPFQVDTETLGGRIKKYRVEHGLSYFKFGEIVGVDASTIGTWENSEHVPNRATQEYLEELFNQKEPSKWMLFISADFIFFCNI